jgi:beta-N-acetylhexosaminidase
MRPAPVLVSLVVAALAAAPAAAVPPPSQLAGQRIVWSFPGPVPPSWLEDGIRRGEVGSVLLFADNGRDPDAVARLVARLQAVPRPPGLDAPLLVMIDQEGGPVRRLDGPPAEGGAGLSRRPVGASRAAGCAVGALLRRAGVNVNLAPVVDVPGPGSVIARQGRALGGGAAAVTRRAVAFADGLAASGVAASPKHFPGLGAAVETTDEAPVRITLPAARLRARDGAPYRALIRRGVPMVMVGTAVYTAFGPGPAALQPRVVRGELRNRLGFRGVVVADALDTPALASWGSHSDVARLAAAAGVDLLPFIAPDAARQAAKGVRDGLLRGRLSPDEAQRSLERVMTLRWMLAMGVALTPPASGAPALGLPAC